VNEAEPSQDWLNPLAMAGKKGPLDSFYFTMLHPATSPCAQSGFVRRRAERSRMLGLVLNGLPNAEIGQVIVIALTAEGIAAAFHTAVIADRRSTITALRHGRLATRHPDVVISEFNLTMHYFHLRAG
jgi:hypothetical protein